MWQSVSVGGLCHASGYRRCVLSNRLRCDAGTAYGGERARS